MADTPSLSGAFNKSAPPYQPELWNSQVTDDQVLDLLKRNRAAAVKILGSQPIGPSPETDIQNFPLLRMQTVIERFAKAVEQLGDDEKVAKKFGLTAQELAGIKDEALKLYHNENFERYANCYTYAMNDRDRYNHGGDSPGERASGIPGSVDYSSPSLDHERTRDYEGYKAQLLKGVEADGAIIAGKDAAPLDGYYRVAVYAMPPDKMPKSGDNSWTDMHFVREDQDGGWSHKPGRTPVTNKDQDGKPITDPKTANLGGYEFLTYVYVPEGGLDVGPSYEPSSKPRSVQVPHNPDDDWKRKASAAFPEPAH